jgi:ketosteroid isomerase-like protein
MSTQENVQIVMGFFAAMGRGDKQGLLELSAEDMECIIPGEDLAADRHAPRARGIGGFASEGFRNAGNFIPKAL